MVFKRESSDDEQKSPDQSSLDFEQMLNESLTKSERRLTVGDRINAEILSMGKEQVIVSTGTQFDGYVSASDLKGRDLKSGDWVDLFVTYVKGSQIFLSPNPTAQNLSEDIQEAFSQNRPVEGKVESVNKGGFQVNVLGKPAFCPMSQMDLKRIDRPEDYVGQRFEFKISQLGEGGRNIVVSRRKILEEGQGLAMANFKDQRKVGDVITGTVTRVENFGAFIELSPGLEGLAHVSELSWARVSNPLDVVKPGQTVKATILGLEPGERRLKISLSLKRPEDNPWLHLEATVQAGRVVSGKITRCVAFGAFVELQPGVEGLIPLSEMSSAKRVAQATEMVQEGETVAVLVKNVDLNARRISLSLKDAVEAAASASEAEDIRGYAASQESRPSFGAQGDLAAKLEAAMGKQKNR